MLKRHTEVISKSVDSSSKGFFFLGLGSVLPHLSKKKKKNTLDKI